MKHKDAGIDYGRGLSNVDLETGHRYGVMKIGSLHDFIRDSLEPEYPESENDDESFDCEPLGWHLNTSQYEAHSAFDQTCLFLTKSPFYTLTSFCSPCAPGAGDLDTRNENGVKTLCFGHEMFDGEIAPYAVYRVSDDSLVLPNNGGTK
jgi:hypothetical protein